MKKWINLFCITFLLILLLPAFANASDVDQLIASWIKLAIVGMFISSVSFMMMLLILRGFFLWYFKINKKIDLLTEIKDLLKIDSTEDKKSFSYPEDLKTPSFTLKTEPINDDNRFKPPGMR